MSNCNPIHPDRKSTVENSTRRAQLTPAERARRVTELCQVLHAPYFQARVAAEHGRVST